MQPTGSNPHSDEAFQQLLLSLPVAASKGQRGSALLERVCKSSREFFGVSGCYVWRVLPSGELVGTHGDGHRAEAIAELRVGPGDPAVVLEAIRARRCLYVNDLDPVIYPLASRFGGRSVMAAPFFVFGECKGALVLLHTAEPKFFHDDLAAKATILAGQVGSLLEAERLEQQSREEHRRANILLEFAQNLPAVPDVTAVVEALADRLRTLLGARAVGVLLKKDGELGLGAVAAETPQLATAVRQVHQGSALIYTAELAGRAAVAGEAIQAASPDLPEVAKSMIVAPLRTSRSAGAVFIYPRAEYNFSPEDKSLLAAVAGFGAVAIANAELYATAALQAQDLHQLLGISTQLGGAGNFDEFLQRFVVRAAEFLGFRRSLIGLVEGDRCRVRYIAEHGQPKRLDCSFPCEESHTLIAKEPFWTEDGTALGSERRAVLGPAVRQLVDVPLIGTDGSVLGLLELLDRVDEAPVSKEDVARAQALAAQVAVVLELRRNLHASEQHRRRAEDLISLALDLSYTLSLGEFGRNFAARAAGMMGARSAGLLVTPVHKPGPGSGRGSGQWETVAWDRALPSADRALDQRLQVAIAELARAHTEPIASGTAEEWLGTALAQALDWHDITLARLESSEHELLGVLCLGDLRRDLGPEDGQLLRALANHAAVALQNARLFNRMEQANRHWVEIFDAITDFIVVHDEAENVLRVNRSLAHFIKVSPAELIGVSMRAMLSLAADTYATECPFCRKAEGSGDEFLHQVLDRTYLVSTSRIHGLHADGLQTIHVLKDVTDRREAERRYRELFDNIQEGLYFSTPAGRFIEVNDALVRMLGYESRDELLQVDIASHLYFEQRDRQRFGQLIEEQGVLRNHEEVLRRKDGTPVYTMQNVFAVRDSRGQVLQYRGLMSDISGLKAFQTELQRERDFSSKILNNTQSLILVVDPAGRISYANRRWADLNYQFQQLLGRRLVDLTPATKRSLLQEALQATLEGRPVDNLEVPILRADGRIGQFSVNLNPMRDEQAALTSIVVVMTDITDAAMLQAKLMHAEKMAAVGQLVSGVAHEVNNPLTAILGFADLLMENSDVPESAKKDLRVILQEAQRTKQIVQNLLSFARQMPPQRKPVQVNAILRRTVQLRAYDFNSHGVEVVEHLLESLPDVVGDSHQLQQVFLNILNNAYDAVRETGRPPRIEITTNQGRGYAEVSFRDNGNGILSPDRIFDPFFTTKEVGKGTGLGLSICYGIVREHGGEIFCQNNTGTPGATFIVRLPLAAENVSLSAVAGVIPS